MKTFFADLFEYHRHFNNELILQFEEHKDQVADKLLETLSHVFNAHQIWNARILNEETYGVYELHSFEKLKEMNQDNYQKTIHCIQNYPLDLKISYTNSKGNAFENSVRDILFHIANHSTHHKGQLVAGLRYHGISPVITDYIFYKR